MKLIHQLNDKESILLSFNDLRVAVVRLINYCRENNLTIDKLQLPNNPNYQNDENDFILASAGNNYFILRKEEENDGV